MNRQISIAIGVIFLIVAAVLSNVIGGMKKPAEVIPEVKNVKMVKSLPVQNGDINTQVEITGRLFAKNKIELFTEVSGTLLPNGNRFKEGNFFKSGQVMVRIDNEEPMLNLLAQKSALMNQITLMLPDLKADYPESFGAWETYLQEMDVEQPLKALPEAVTEQEKYFVSAKNLYNLYYTIRSQEKRMEKYELKAPFSGVVSSSMITEGTLVRAGQKIGEYMNANSYELEASINEKDVDLVKVGSQVQLFDAEGKDSWKGIVARISRVIDPATQTVKVFINTSGRDLREGMYLKANVKGRAVSAATEINRNLLVDQQKVYVIQDSLLKLVNVEPVYFTTNTAIVTGIPEGSLLLNENIIGAYEGLKVGPYQD